jgi:signal transduction histidine kinase
MLLVPLPDNEEERLASLRSYNILDTLEEKDFDEITQLASQICQTPVALITLIDDKRQWFKSSVGVDIAETTREVAFCAHNLYNKEEIMVVEDARHDERFADNPLVTGSFSVAFYAGVPLVNEEGHALGSLCVIDNKAKKLNDQQINTLKILGKQVMAQLELRKKIASLEIANAALLESNTFIQKFASTAAHDIKNPLSSILLTSQALQRRLQKNEDDKSLSLINLSIHSSKQLLHLVDEMLVYSRSPSSLLMGQQTVELNTLLNKIIRIINVPESIKVQLPAVDHTIKVSAVALEQIITNLLTNAIRYNDKDQGSIKIQFREDDQYYYLKVADNGVGIEPYYLTRIFEDRFTLDSSDRFNQKGTGIGLSTVKALVEKLQGTVYAESTPGEGTSMFVSIKK